MLLGETLMNIKNILKKLFFCSNIPMIKPFSSEQGQSNTNQIVTLDDRIAIRAKQIWEEEGQPVGRADEHWFRAKNELLNK
jgi:hypothetical protein